MMMIVNDTNTREKGNNHEKIKSNVILPITNSTRLVNQVSQATVAVTTPSCLRVYFYTSLLISSQSTCLPLWHFYFA